jgi:rubrerythrin
MSTKENLEAAFAGESQANRKYLAFAKKADDEGYPQVAKLFRAAADAETVHAHAHLNVLNGVGKTEDNLKAAIEGETYEFSEMYPKFIDEAKAEGNKAAVTSFYRANEVEKVHGQLYQKALEGLGQNADVDYYVCQVCGNTFENGTPDTCPVCGQPKATFKKVD